MFGIGGGHNAEKRALQIPERIGPDTFDLELALDQIRQTITEGTAAGKLHIAMGIVLSALSVALAAGRRSCSTPFRDSRRQSRDVAVEKNQ